MAPFDFLLYSTISVDNFSPPLTCCALSKPTVSFLNKYFVYFHFFQKKVFKNKLKIFVFQTMLNRAHRIKLYLVCHDSILLHNAAGNAITILKKSLQLWKWLCRILIRFQENIVLCAIIQRSETIQGCYNDFLLYENPR